MTDVTVCSSGASSTRSPSYAPRVQKTSRTVTPAFFAASRNAAARFCVSEMLRAPCSVKRINDT
jgi:hypothetical protein